jgi:nucleotide-binding universal stress UspA family protein
MTMSKPFQVIAVEHVLVPLDGSEFAAFAVPAARALAERLGADTHAITVTQKADEVDRLRADVASALRTGVGDERVAVVVGADPADEIARRARDLEPSVVCLTTHGRGRVGGALLGSVATALLQRSRDPIVAIGPHALDDAGAPRPNPSFVGRLVACVDGSPASEAVLPVAAAWARVLGMSMTILTVAEPVPEPLRPDGGWGRHHGPDGDADEYVAGLAQQWQLDGVEVTGAVEYDPIGPAAGLAAHLERQPAGLVAVTTHARAGLARLVLGSSSASIMHASVAPVIVVPPPG